MDIAQEGTMLGMFKKLKGLFGRRPVVVPNAAGLLEGEAKTIEVGDMGSDGRQILLCRVGGKIFGLDTLCPHAEGGRLSRGPLHEGRFAVCPMHSYKFDVKTGAPQDVNCGHARTVRCEEREGNIEVFA
jgi:nitrite reductase/ring-hydroxylating ferredoxin subunit